MVNYAISYVTYWLIIIAANSVAMGLNDCSSISSSTIDFNCQSTQPLLDVVYNDQHSVTCNELLPKSTYSGQPSVIFKQAQKNKNYTLVMVDPDAPSSQNKYFLHWIATNIIGEDFSVGNLKNSNNLVSYAPPSPPQGSGIHRYQLFAFDQPQSTVTMNTTGRARFDLVQFLRDNGLQCQPVAENQFRTQFASQN